MPETPNARHRWDADEIAAWCRWLRTPAAVGYQGWCDCRWCEVQREDFRRLYEAGERWLPAGVGGDAGRGGGEGR